MDLAKTLIRSVARAFYDIESILIIDALMVHSALNGNDLASCLNMQEKPMRKYAQQLRADGLVHAHTQQIKNESNRLHSREVFYINFHLAIDAIKFRLYKMTKKIESLSAPDSTERKELLCPRCHMDWNVMEVIDNLSMDGSYLCHRCQSVLQFRSDEADLGVSTPANATIKRLNNQLSPLLALMQRLDSSTVPENDWETALANARPIQRAKEDQGIKNETVVDSQLRVVPQKVKGLDTQERVEVSIVGATTAEEEERRRREERERKEALRIQNQLPSWHTHSTITGMENGTNTAKTGAKLAAGANGVGSAAVNGKVEEEDKKVVLKDANNNADLDEYFANLHKLTEQEGEASQRSSPREDEDEEDEEEFEDVTLPASTNGAANGSEQNSDGEREKKKVRIEIEDADAAAEGKKEAPVEVVDSDEDEDDFVDAM
ncbi:MAG: hypothetical protein M1820_004783 [Bogoriella megaspora]|nr:MAG: hypothetical protein M1820_004783 [Bogoriella megaspora]